MIERFIITKKQLQEKFAKSKKPPVMTGFGEIFPKLREHIINGRKK